MDATNEYRIKSGHQLPEKEEKTQEEIERDLSRKERLPIFVRLTH